MVGSNRQMRKGLDRVKEKGSLRKSKGRIREKKLWDDGKEKVG
jgi:hypothetical protein